MQLCGSLKILWYCLFWGVSNQSFSPHVQKNPSGTFPKSWLEEFRCSQYGPTPGTSKNGSRPDQYNFITTETERQSSQGFFCFVLFCFCLSKGPNTRSGVLATMNDTVGNIINNDFTLCFPKPSVIFQLKLSSPSITVSRVQFQIDPPACLLMVCLH